MRWLFSFLVLMGVTGCGQTQHQGTIHYTFEWTSEAPESGTRVSDEGVQAFLRSLDEDDCDPVSVTSVEMTVDGDLRFDRASLTDRRGTILSVPFSNAGRVSTPGAARFAHTGVDDEETVALVLESPEGDGPATVRFDMDVEVNCGTVWK
jgi:hypothetical protein